jgi:biotin operon repressor
MTHDSISTLDALTIAMSAENCLAILEQADEPLTAVAIAERLRLHGCRETQRRVVRAMIKELRDRGYHIVATLTDGYALTRDDGIWKDYTDGRLIDAKRILAEVSRRNRDRQDRGQGLLFSLHPCGLGRA